MVSTHLRNMSQNGNLPQIIRDEKKMLETTTQSVNYYTPVFQNMAMENPPRWWVFATKNEDYTHQFESGPGISLLQRELVCGRFWFLVNHQHHPPTNHWFKHHVKTHTLHGTYISHLGKRKNIFKSAYTSNIPKLRILSEWKLCRL